MPRRAGDWNRKTLLSDSATLAREKWWVLAGFVGIMLVPISLAWWIASGFWRGFVTGGILTFTVMLLLLVVVVGSGQLHRFFGMTGESSTAEVLETRRRRRQGWIAVHGLQIGGHEIDHIAVGPGGVLAIETKWTNVPWRVERGHLRGPLGDPVAQTRRSAKQVGALLASATGGGLEVPVEPALIIWGPGCPRLSSPVTKIDGVPVYSARDLSGFEQRLDAPVLEVTMWREAQAALRRYADRQEEALG